MRCSARKSDHPDLKPLFADVAAEEKAWFAKHRVVPINHMVVVSRTLSEQHPDAVREVHRLLADPPRRRPPRRGSTETRCGARWN